MQFLSFIAANALLFMSLILVVGVPVLLAKGESGRSGAIRWIEIGSVTWLVLLLANTGLSFFVV